MEVQTHDARLGDEGVFRVGGVLYRVETDESHSLPEEVVAAQSHCEQIRIPDLNK